MKALTPQEAREIYHAGPEAVVKVLCELSAAVERLEGRTKELENQLAQNSRNSSKPPSSDVFKNYTSLPYNRHRQVFIYPQSKLK